MAEKRMFTQRIVESDAFQSLPHAAQALYFHLGMLADDDGFLNNAKRIAAMLEIPMENFNLLVSKRFLLAFDNGVVCLKHWRMHNSIRKDRYNPTQYREEFESLIVKPNGAYTEGGDIMGTKRGQGGDIMGAECTAQYSIVENSIVESSEDKERVGVQGEREPTPSYPNTKNVDKSVENPKLGKYANVQLSQKELAMLKLKYPAHWERMVDDLSAFIHSSGETYDRHYDIITGWAGGAV